MIHVSENVVHLSQDKWRHSIIQFVYSLDAWSKALKFIRILSRHVLIAVRRDSRQNCCVAHYIFELPIFRTARNINKLIYSMHICANVIGKNIPFSQAEKKGASPSEYGLVFGIFELVVFIISPIYGQHVSDNIINVYIRCIYKIFNVTT